MALFLKRYEISKNLFIDDPLFLSFLPDFSDAYSFSIGVKSLVQQSRSFLKLVMQLKQGDLNIVVFSTTICILSTSILG